MIKGIDWILCPTANFDDTVVFFRDFLGLPLSASGVPTVDRQFARYAQFTAPDRTTLEIVEPTAAARDVFRAPVVSLTVADLAASRAQLAARRVEFVAPIFADGDGWGWTYLRAPDGQVYQIQGPYRAE